MMTGDRLRLLVASLKVVTYLPVRLGCWVTLTGEEVVTGSGALTIMRRVMRRNWADAASFSNLKKTSPLRLARDES